MDDMIGIREYFSNIRHSIVSIFEGMAVTFSWMLRRPHTIQYPDRIESEKTLIQERFRGLLEVDISHCTGCLACQRACPIGVIMIDVSKGTDRFITRFDIDASKCMYCGLCTEACPVNAIRHTRQFAFSVTDIRKLVLHYVKEPVKPYKPVKDAEVLREGPGRFVSQIIKERDTPYEQYKMPALPPVETNKDKENL